MKNQTKYLLYIVVGLLLYEAASYLGAFYMNSTVIHMIALFLFLVGFFCVDKYNIKCCDYSLVLLIIWSMVIVLRGSLIGNFYKLETGEEYSSIWGIIKAITNNPHSAIAVLMPCMALIKSSQEVFCKIVKLALPISIICLLLVIEHSDSLFASTLGISSTIINGMVLSKRQLVNLLFPGFGIVVFALLCYDYVRYKWKTILPIVVFVYFLSLASGGGRGATITALLYLIAFIVLKIRYPLSFAKTSKFVKRFSALFLAAFTIYSVWYVYSYTDIFTFILNRIFVGGEIGGEIMESNRIDFKAAMISDFNEHPLSWIFGRGINGGYIHNNRFRMWMEDGIYWLILKGGIIYLVLYIYVLLKHSFLGIFRSSNLISKAFGMLLLLQTISLYFFGLPTVSVSFCIVWLGVAWLANKDLRMLPEEEVFLLFNK